MTIAYSQIEVCNLALQKLGVGSITSLEDGSEQARALSRVYPIAYAALLQHHPWAFAITRVELSASAETPAFDFSYQFPLPAGCLFVIRPADVDWVMEGRMILSNDAGPLQVRYVKDMGIGYAPPLFAEALACQLAVDLCEALVGSTQKYEQVWADRQRSIAAAKRVGAIERGPTLMPDVPWVTRR